MSVYKVAFGSRVSVFVFAWASAVRRMPELSTLGAKMIGRLAGAALLCLLVPGFHAQAETVRFAHQDTFPPFVEVQNGNSEGLFVDLLIAAAKRAEITAVFVPVPFTQVQRTLEDGRADAIFPIGITSARRQTFDFSDAFLATGGALYVRAPEPTPNSLAALSGKIVVTPQTGPLAAIIRKTAPDVKLVVTANYEESLARLVKGEADAAALNFQVGAKLASKLYPGKLTIPRTMFFEVPLAVGVLKGRNNELVARLNKGLSAIKADGTWQQINHRWTGQ